MGKGWWVVAAAAVCAAAAGYLRKGGGDGAAAAEDPALTAQRSRQVLAQMQEHEQQERGDAEAAAAEGRPADAADSGPADAADSPADAAEFKAELASADAADTKAAVFDPGGRVWTDRPYTWKRPPSWVAGDGVSVRLLPTPHRLKFTSPLVVAATAPCFVVICVRDSKKQYAAELVQAGWEQDSASAETTAGTMLCLRSGKGAEGRVSVPPPTSKRHRGGLALAVLAVAAAAPPRRPRPPAAAPAARQPRSSHSHSRGADGLWDPPDLPTAPPAPSDPFAGPPTCTPSEGRPGPRPLHHVVEVQEGVEWPHPERCAEERLAPLCGLLRRLAVNREVMIALANHKAPGLGRFIHNVKERIGIPNFMIVALDDILAKRLDDEGVPYWLRPMSAEGNHKISAEKFAVVRDFIDVGCAVLMTDTDVVYFQDPFPHLGHDHDVESMSDGWDEASSYGFHDEIRAVLPWGSTAAPARSGRFQALNSGLWYAAATHASRRLMDIMAHRMQHESTWDQAAWNMELMFPSRDAHLAAGASLRILSPLCFMNSKVLMRIIRPRLLEYAAGEKLAEARRHSPVALHANYHQDKPYKMEQSERLWLGGEENALDDCVCPPGVEYCGCKAGVVPVTQLEKGWKGEGYSRPQSFANGLAAAVGQAAGQGNDLSFKGPRRAGGECRPLEPWSGALPRTSSHELHKIRRVPCGSLGHGLSGRAHALCLAARRVEEGGGDVLLVAAGGRGAADTEPALLRAMLKRTVRLGLQSKALVVAMDDGAAQQAVDAGVLPVPCKDGSVDATVQKWRCVADVLRSGVSAFVADPAVVVLRDPFPHLYRDADVEAASDGWDDRSAYGYDHVVDDKLMGWSRFVHGPRLGSRDPGMFYITATAEAAVLAARVAARLAASETARVDEGLRFTEELFLPSHDAYTSAGVVPRTLNYACFGSKRTVDLLTHKNLRPVMVHARFSDPASKGAAVKEIAGRW